MLTEASAGSRNIRTLDTTLTGKAMALETLSSSEHLATLRKIRFAFDLLYRFFQFVNCPFLDNFARSQIGQRVLRRGQWSSQVTER